MLKGVMVHKRYIGIISVMAVLLLFSGCRQRIAVDPFSPPIAKAVESDENDSEITPVLTIAVTITPSPMPTVTKTPIPTVTSSPIPTPTPTPIPSIHLIAVGDDLIHQTVVNSGKKKDGSYDYTHLYAQLKDEITAADLAVINQETILGTKDMKYAGYPAFCSPMEIGDAVIDAGFDIVLHATNHSMDRKVKGIMTTLKYWEQHPEITVLGMHKDQESYDQVTYYEMNGIKIALLNYTYGLNGYSLPKDQPFLVDLFDKQHMIKQLKTARSEADFVIVFPHWGNEYVYKPNAWQKEWTQFFADMGVDLVIGAHPHVLQPVEWITAKDDHKMLVFYSLGNYVSTMDYTDRMLGGMADVTIKKDEERTYIEEASLTPIVTHFERGSDNHIAVYRLSEYTEELAKKHFIRGGRRGADFSIKRLWELANQIIGEKWLTKETASTIN